VVGRVEILHWGRAMNMMEDLEDFAVRKAPGITKKMMEVVAKAMEEGKKMKILSKATLSRERKKV